MKLHQNFPKLNERKIIIKERKESLKKERERENTHMGMIKE